MTQFICLAIVFRKSEVIQQNKEGGKMSLSELEFQQKNLLWREYEYFLELHAFICCPHSSAILLQKLTDTREEIGATEKSPEDQDPDCVSNDQ